MKTVEELYKEINASEELKRAVSEIKDKTALADFLKKHGCEASVDEFGKYIKSQIEGEIGDDEVASVAGGVSKMEANGPISDFFHHIFHPNDDD